MSNTLPWLRYVKSETIAMGAQRPRDFSLPINVEGEQIPSYPANL